MKTTNFTTADLESLSQRNISTEEGDRQLVQLRQENAFLPIDQPCTIGNGITAVEPDNIPELSLLFDTAAAANRFTRFVPASGAASRMFQGLFPEAMDPDKVSNLRARIRQFPFYPELSQSTETPLEQLGDQIFLSLLLGSDGLNLAAKPKGLLPLHRGIDYNRTAFAEHLHEGCSLGIRDFHFTVSPEHQPFFQQQFELIRAELGRYATEVQVHFSVQSPQTDTIALDLQTNKPFHIDKGELVFRPAGHGALLQNLEGSSGDLVLIRNIDNVVPENLDKPYKLWTRILGGKLVEIQQQVFHWLEQLATTTDDKILSDAENFLQQTFGRSTDDNTPSGAKKAEQLITLLDRPIRICGMVPVSGQPGGGPFWAKDALGQISPQIIEGVQIDPDDPQQIKVLKESTHFNPVNIACSLRDWAGRPYCLADFVDQNAAIITSKNDSGRDLLALERPGLWNGAMSGWNSLFIEMPAETFNPIKTVFDLLQPSHQPG